MQINQTTIEHFTDDKPALVQEFGDSIPPSSKDEMDTAVAVLHANKDKWINLNIDHKVKILDQILIDLNEIAEDWVSTSLRAKCAPENSICEGEEWFYLDSSAKPSRACV